MDSGRLKHLEMIQQVITRMANNSFLIKGWSLTLLAALLALALRDKIYQMLWISIIPVTMFWILDSYFLRQEMLFRKLYDKYRIQDQETRTDFSMDTSELNSVISSWLCTIFSTTLLIFHGTVFFIVIALSAYFHCRPV